MKAGLDAGRFLHYAPIGYLNVNKDLAVDPDRAPLARKAFELLASGNYSTNDAVLMLVTGMGLRTRKGRPLTKQSWGRLPQNPIYCGWIVSGNTRVRGKHEPLISEEIFEAVQKRINGKSRPHEKVNEEFPFRGFVHCAKCGKKLTAGWVQGREKKVRSILVLAKGMPRRRRERKGTGSAVYGTAFAIGAYRRIPCPAAHDCSWGMGRAKSTNRKGRGGPA